MSSSCPIWARSSGARCSTASNWPCRACSRAAPGQDHRRDLWLPRSITPACCATACRRRRTITRCTAKCPAPRWTAPGLACGTDSQGPWIAVDGHARICDGLRRALSGDAARRAARRARRTSTSSMEVENLSAAPMDLMYLCHVNFAFSEGGRIVQPAPFTPRSCGHSHRHPRLMSRRPTIIGLCSASSPRTRRACGS